MNPLEASTEDALVAYLLQFVTPAKRARMEAVMAARTSHLQVVLEDIYQPHNASAVLRSCECFGIQHLHVVENRHRYTLNREVALGASKWIHLHRYRETEADNTRTCLEALRSRGYRIVATSLDPASLPLHALPVGERLSLWFGTEELGLSDQVLQAADAHVHIPMFGFTQSFNISVSVALCLYDLRRRIQDAGLPWALNSAEQREVYRLWIRSTVRKADILERAFLAKLPPANAPS